MEKTEKINFTNFHREKHTETERESEADRQTERRHGLFAHIN